MFPIIILGTELDYSYILQAPACHRAVFKMQDFQLLYRSGKCLWDYFQVRENLADADGQTYVSLEMSSCHTWWLWWSYCFATQILLLRSIECLRNDSCSYYNRWLDIFMGLISFTTQLTFICIWKSIMYENENSDIQSLTF